MNWKLQNNNMTIKEYQHQWYLNNKQRLNSRSKELYENNKEERLIKAKEYREKNREKRNEHTRKRKEIDPLFKLNKQIQNLFLESFKRKGLRKNSKTSIMLGCTIKEFKLYIELKFEPWMNWNNRGLYNGTISYGWDIDHIIPISLAKTEEDIIKLNHYTNLQPLCSYKNRVVKRNKYEIQINEP